MSKKIDISSTVLEKGIDLAKGFLDKLISPALEETGLLLKDKVTLWKFKNQVKMLNKAKEHCENNNISTKAISLKLLCPLLDYAALEEDEILQDKWAILLSNMVDSEQNIENHVFPYLLSQISTNEFLLIEMVLSLKNERDSRLIDELSQLKKDKPSIIKDIDLKVKELKEQISNIKEKGKKPIFPQTWEFQQKINALENEKREFIEKERKIEKSIIEPELVPYDDLEEYEISNLVRLGIIKSVPRPYAYVSGHQIYNNPNSEYLSLDDLEIEIESEADDFILTGLGEKFIEACNVKTKAPNNS